MPDFSKAKKQIDTSSMTSEQRKQHLKDELYSRFDEVLNYLLPNGKVQGHEYVCGDVYGNNGDSLKVRLTGDKKGVWSDFADDKRGGDLIDLWQEVRSCNFKDALEEIESFLGEEPRPVQLMRLSERPKEKKDLGEPTETWTYLGVNHQPLVAIARFDDPETGKKEFRPWDYNSKSQKMPSPRPLYNLPGIKDADHVVLVEGEKCADALIRAGIAATTAMAGSNARPDLTDFEILNGKIVLIWPDNDKPGLKYAENWKSALEDVAEAVFIADIPEDKPKKWDAADAVEDGFDVAEFCRPRRNLRSIKSWDISEIYLGEAPEREWLVNNTIPLGAVTLFSAAGDAGKGMICLDLALKVASRNRGQVGHYHTAFGHRVNQEGSAVIISAEDDQSEIHRRLQNIDNQNLRSECYGRLKIMALPDAGGPMPFIVSDKSGKPETTKEFKNLKEDLMDIDDLKLIVIDPLASFVLADINKDPMAGQFSMGVFAHLANITRASVIIPHHMRKKAAFQNVTTSDQARDMIRGSTSIVDGVRCAYALWSLNKKEVKSICELLNLSFDPNRIFAGAVVKSNGPADRDIKTFVRNDAGLLEDRTQDITETRESDEHLLNVLQQEIAEAAIMGNPFTKTGASGLFENRERLAAPLNGLADHSIRSLCQRLLDQHRVFKCRAPGSRVASWLDVLGGPFQQGIGEFAPGFEPRN